MLRYKEPMQLAPPVRIMAAYSILCGLTPLIPVPFLDDVVQERITRRMIVELAQYRSVTLSQQQVEALSAPPTSGGLFRRVASAVVLYPVKKVLRKTFLVLEGKRAVDLVAHTYALAWLIDAAIRTGIFPGNGVLSPVDIRSAAEQACAKRNTSPIEHAVRKVLDESRGSISKSVEGLWSGASSDKTEGAPASAEAEREVERVTKTAEQALPVNTMAEKLEQLLRELPGDYLPSLEEEFFSRVNAIAGKSK